MNLINFHDNPINKKFIKEIKIKFCGQGLIYSYFVEIFGNGFNTYIFFVEHEKKKYKIYFDEKHILHWTIKTQYLEMENIEPHSYIDFCGYGKMHSDEINYLDKYYWFYSGDCDDFSNIYYLDYKFKIIKIKIKNINKKIKIITHITNENAFANLIKYKDECIKEMEIISDINNIDNYNLTDIKKINYENWILNYDMDTKYYFVVDNLEKNIFPFEIISIIKKTNDIDLLSCLLYYKNFIHNISIEMLYDKTISDNNNDEYNIEISFEIKKNNENIIKNDEENICEYCYIVA